MRYGHLLAGIIFLLFLFVLVAVILTVPRRLGKIDVSTKPKAASTSTAPRYYTSPETQPTPVTVPY